MIEVIIIIGVSAILFFYFAAMHAVRSNDPNPPEFEEGFVVITVLFWVLLIMIFKLVHKLL